MKQPKEATKRQSNLQLCIITGKKGALAPKRMSLLGARSIFQYKNMQSELEKLKQIKDNNIVLCDSAIEVLKKLQRNNKDVTTLMCYLETLKSFVDMIKRDIEEANFEILIKNLSLLLKYCLCNENEILFRYGDKGDMFYLIIKGRCSVLIPKDEKANLTLEEYLIYLFKLKRYRENEVFSQCLMKNRHNFKLDEEDLDYLILSGVIQSNRLVDLDSQKIAKKFNKHAIIKAKQTFSQNSILNRRSTFVSIEQQIQITMRSLLKDDILLTYNSIMDESDILVFDSMQDYIDKLKPELKEYKSERKSFNIFVYSHVADLNDGDKFGEYALDSFAQKRNATILATKKTHLGMLEKKSYNECIKSILDKITKDQKNYILSIPIFLHCNSINFIDRYFCFVGNKKLNWNDVLIEEGDQVEMVYIIKEGEFEITFNKSIIQIDEILSKINPDMSHVSKYQQEEVFIKNDKFIKFLNEKKISKLKNFKNFELIGLNDSLLKDKYIFNVKCVSNKCDIFQIKASILKQLCASDPIIQKNILEYTFKKEKDYYEKFLSIKNSRLSFYRSFQQKEKEEVIKKDAKANATSRLPPPIQMTSFKNIQNAETDLNLPNTSRYASGVSYKMKKYEFPRLEFFPNKPRKNVNQSQEKLEVSPSVKILKNKYLQTYLDYNETEEPLDTKDIVFPSTDRRYSKPYELGSDYSNLASPRQSPIKKIKSSIKAKLIKEIKPLECESFEIDGNEKICQTDLRSINKGDELESSPIKQNYNNQNYKSMIIKKNPKFLYENIFSMYIKSDDSNVNENNNELRLSNNICRDKTSNICSNSKNQHNIKIDDPNIIDFLVMDKFNKIYNSINFKSNNRNTKHFANHKSKKI